MSTTDQADSVTDTISDRTTGGRTFTTTKTSGTVDVDIRTWPVGLPSVATYLAERNKPLPSYISEIVSRRFSELLE